MRGAAGAGIAATGCTSAGAGARVLRGPVGRAPVLRPCVAWSGTHRTRAAAAQIGPGSHSAGAEVHARSRRVVARIRLDRSHARPVRGRAARLSARARRGSHLRGNPRWTGGDRGAARPGKRRASLHHARAQARSRLGTGTLCRNAAAGTRRPGQGSTRCAGTDSRAAGAARRADLSRSGDPEIDARARTGRAAAARPGLTVVTSSDHDHPAAAGAGDGVSLAAAPDFVPGGLTMLVNGVTVTPMRLALVDLQKIKRDERRRMTAV